MTRHFCTLFDGNYLFKAVVLHRSLQRHCPSFHLTAFCFDDQARRVIDALELPHVSTVSLGELEAFDSELRGIKSERSQVEYMWTATPCLPLYELASRPELAEVTYLDADLMFFSDPEPIFEEMGGASVLITPHRFAPEFAQQQVNGIYNVQFLTFRRDANGLEALEWWHDRCIEWCYYRLEDGKLGDQKYLDDWPERFEGVHVLRNKGGGLAPWNITQYQVRADDERTRVDEDALVFFHFHRVRLLDDGGYDWAPPGYHITPDNYGLIYQPYLAALDRAKRTVWQVEPSFRAGLVAGPSARERLREARARIGAAAVRRAPWLLRLRHPSLFAGR